jgi:hypothetical protein
MSTHEHQWIFAGEVVIPTKEPEISNDPFNRLEYCIVCGAFRIRFGHHWRFWYSDATKEYLGQFDAESHKVLKLAPPEFKLRPPARGEKRLGRGLVDLLETMKNRTDESGIFTKRKPDAKTK